MASRRFADNPPAGITSTKLTQPGSLETMAQMVQRGSVDPLVRTTAIQIIRAAGCTDRDDDCELHAIYDAVKNGSAGVPALKDGFMYVNDPRYADYFTAAGDSLRACLKGSCGGDCLPGETLLLGAGYNPVAISDVRPGDYVLGDGQWVKVTQWWEKGVLPTLDFKLRNGCVLRCTADHKVFAVPASAPRSEAYEVRAGDLKPGDELLTAETIPAGREQLNPDKAWLLGLHIADGWVDRSQMDGRPLRVGISAKDGWRKESNKERLSQLCEQWGFPTRWHEKYLAINDEATAQWLAACGRGSTAKRLPSLDFDLKTVEAILSGLAADADIRNGVFSTTSPQLALQYRVMLRMQGLSVHVTRVDRHGGLGSNPIYRVTPRRPVGQVARGSSFQNARVMAISEGPTLPVFDIEVEGHRFYLPETDLIVHNCDDASILIGSLLASVGWRVGMRGWGVPDSDGMVHVYPVAAYPKRGNPQAANGLGDFYSRGVGLDATVPEAYVGWEPPQTNMTLTAWVE